jgi:nucleotide-binding universal stress UspA family protein
MAQSAATRRYSLQPISAPPVLSFSRQGSLAPSTSRRREQSRELYARMCLRACEERVAANEGRLDLLELPGRQIVVLGSVTVKVLTHSNIPVLVYR